MLFQLVCTDRRYARMNCFNIRELQGMLKRKYFVDLLNTLDHKDLLNQSMINLRFKTNCTNNLGLDFFNFQNLGLHRLDSSKIFLYISTNAVSTENQQAPTLSACDNYVLPYCNSIVTQVTNCVLLEMNFLEILFYTGKLMNFYFTNIFNNIFTLIFVISNINLSSFLSTPSLTLFFS